MISALGAFKFYIQFSIFNFLMENEKLKNTTAKRCFSLPNSSKTRRDGFAQNVLYHGVFTAFVLETDLSGEVKMDVFIGSFVTNLPRVSGGLFSSHLAQKERYG